MSRYLLNLELGPLLNHDRIQDDRGSKSWDRGAGARAIPCSCQERQLSGAQEAIRRHREPSFVTPCGRRRCRLTRLLVGANFGR